VGLGHGYHGVISYKPYYDPNLISPKLYYEGHIFFPEVSKPSYPKNLGLSNQISDLRFVSLLVILGIKVIYFISPAFWGSPARGCLIG
jgi:hypothetical protein